ncbi:MAG: class I SAM-dependent methyltransferase [Alphaproteobacteria bacterium]|nr:class I SAM-dependent methyltransferase [Alphaproteobacteria bacterium]
MLTAQESITAKLCAFARAVHSNNASAKISDDFLAFDLMGREQYEEIGRLVEFDFRRDVSPPDGFFHSERIQNILTRYILPIPLSRMAFAEQRLKAFARENGRCQYLICGAGMDTFAFRNDNPDIRIFELDRPDTQQYKIRRIKEVEYIIPSDLSFVACDFLADDLPDVLQNSGYDPALPTFISVLGVSYYLPLPAMEKMLAGLGAVLKSGQIVFDFPEKIKTAPRIRQLAEITERLGEPMQGGFDPPQITQALQAGGWNVVSHVEPQAVQRRYFQNRSDGLTAFEGIHFILAQKERKNEKDQKL